MRFDSTCDVCGHAVLRRAADRSDGIAVLRCEQCTHGVVREFPHQLQTLYGDGYFDESDQVFGYSDYEFTAEHGVSWAAALIERLRPSGRVLDVGCADGTLLRKLQGNYERFGIEANARMRQRCEASGIQMIGSDLLDIRETSRFAGSFDIVSAIAVFEHLPQFRGGVEAALELLKPGGLLLFEVPLTSPQHEEDPWFSTSLEHIHYPTIESLADLFQRIGAEQWGAPFRVSNYATTYIGVAGRPQALESASKILRHVMLSGAAELKGLDARCRCLLELVHGATISPELISMIPALRPRDCTPMLLRRISELWAFGISELEPARRSIRELQEKSEQSVQREAQLKQQLARERALANKRLPTRERGHAGNLLVQVAEPVQADEAMWLELMEWQRSAEAREQRVRDLESSFSWRITAPLRRLARVFGIR